MYCKGKMEKGKAPFGIDRNGYQLRWDAIPAWVCIQCGEPYFESKEVDTIYRFSWDGHLRFKREITN